MTFNYDCIGGIMQDLHPDFVKDATRFSTCSAQTSRSTTRYSPATSLPANGMENVGVLTREDAISWAVTGPNGRGSGWACDRAQVCPLQHLLRTRFRRSGARRRRLDGPFQSPHGRNGPERAHHRTGLSTTFPKAITA
ncbi:hypothetical protein [Duncaniella muris]|uniref:NADH-quinone oxidoreductase subunit D-related protein n=1 Tax=Duncaniella muris TaxID=2094150 RepID=UPI003F66AA74